MKKLVVATLALSILAIPAAHAQSRPSHQGQHHINRQAPPPQMHRPAPRRIAPAPQARQQQRAQPRWTRGHRVPHWQQRQVVRDWQRQGLRRPAAGQHWVRIGNDYLLVSILSGLIGGIIAAR